MFGKNKGRYGSRVPDMSPSKSSQTLQKENDDLLAQVKRLEAEIEDLRKESSALEVKKDMFRRCAEIFRSWGGVDIVESSDTKFHVTFLPHFKGHIAHKFSIAFHKYGPTWTVSHYNLPYSMKLIPARVQDARIDTNDKLSSMVRQLQHEVNLFVWREEQFKAAKSLESSMVRIYPSKSTTSVMLDFYVNDVNGSDMSRAFVYLIYHPEKYLPDEPIFKFKGGDKKAEDDFKKQLITLEHMPLKEAISSAFFPNQSFGSESNDTVSDHQLNRSSDSTLSVSRKSKSPGESQGPKAEVRNGSWSQRGLVRGKRASRAKRARKL